MVREAAVVKVVVVNKDGVSRRQFAFKRNHENKPSYAVPLPPHIHHTPTQQWSDRRIVMIIGPSE